MYNVNQGTNMEKYGKQTWKQTMESNMENNQESNMENKHGKQT